MTELSVIGGVYRERCRLPNNTDEIWGSGGRAAAVIAGLGLNVTLHSAVDQRNAPVLASLAKTFGFETAEVAVTRSPEFRYDHGLSSPIIWPSFLPEKVHLEIDAEVALVFGMLEATSDVRAKSVVFDPQNPTSPEPIRFTSGLPRLAYVLNRLEARVIAGTDDNLEAARRISKEHGANVVVVKCGPR